MENSFKELVTAAPAIAVGISGAFVRFLYDGYAERDFSFARFIVGLGIAVLVVWTLAYAVDILGYDLDTKTQQLIYCWAGYTSRDLVFIFSKRFLKFFQTVNLDKPGE